MNSPLPLFPEQASREAGRVDLLFYFLVGMSAFTPYIAQPLIVPTAAQGGPADAQGRAQYRLRVVNNQLLTKSLEQTSLIDDVYRVLFSLRYTFN